MELAPSSVVFGVASSPFLLNATIDTHIRKLETIEPAFVSKFLKSMYVDDLTTSMPDVDSAYAFYQRGGRGIEIVGSWV